MPISGVGFQNLENLLFESLVSVLLPGVVIIQIPFSDAQRLGDERPAYLGQFSLDGFTDLSFFLTSPPPETISR